MKEDRDNLTSPISNNYVPGDDLAQTPHAAIPQISTGGAKSCCLGWLKSTGRLRGGTQILVMINGTRIRAPQAGR